MKLAKLSLAAITVVSLSASAFAADSLADMFKEGTIKGTLSAYYFDRDNGATSADIIDFGLDLTYKTGSYNGLSFGATVQSTHSPFASDSAKTVFNKDMYGSGEVLSEAYVQYVNSGAFLKVGRQYINTPLISGSGSRMTRQSFEGYLLGYTGLQDTTFVAGYLTKYQNRTDKNGNIGTFDNVNTVNGENKDAYTLYVSNTSVTGLKLQAQYANLPDFLSLYYAQADYAGKTDSFSYGVSGQYNMTDYDASTSEDSGYYGLEAKIAMSGLSLRAAYSKVNDDNDAVSGLGGGSNNIFTSSGTLHAGEYGKGDKSYAALITYKFNKDIKAFAYYVDHNLPTSGDDYDIKGAGAGYEFNGALKGLGLSAGYEVKSPDSGKDDTEFRFKAIYAF